MPTEDDDGITHVRLSRVYLDRVQSRTDEFALRHFIKYYTDRGSVLTQADRRWHALRAGDPVPRSVGEGFIDFLNKRFGWQDTYEAVLDPHFPDPAWGDWRDAFGYLSEQFAPRREMYLTLSRRADFMRVASTVAYGAGKLSARVGDRMDFESCRERGEALMQRKVGEYADWLQMLRAWNKTTVLFSCTKDGHRVGVAVYVPLTAEAAAEFAAGELSDKEIKVHHLASPSKYVLINAAFPFQGAESPTTADLNYSEINCLMQGYRTTNR